MPWDEFDSIIKDSSIWTSDESFAAAAKVDASVKVGQIREIQYNETIDDIRYVVEVHEDLNEIPVVCTPITTLGGAFNYEEYTIRGYSATNTKDDLKQVSYKAGDFVLIAYTGGDSRQGVILGGIKHPGRKSVLKPADGIAYNSRFNGVDTVINKDGEWTLTFKGLPTNEADLNKPPKSRLPKAKFDTTVGGSFTKYDKTGSWETNDASTSGIQSIRIDKPAGTTTIKSGAITITLTKNGETIVTQCKDYTLNATDKITENTKDFKVNATSTASIKSPKIAFGTGTVELLQQISDELEELKSLFDTVSSHTHIGNLGYPTAPPDTQGDWSSASSKMGEIKGKIDGIKGTIS